ncbi:hypothetical protein B0A49_04502 [Cryomyces minteri]|uniref:Amino-acid transporter arg-13 n=1 Tax=Cryomyces minteri TaxID=331657 RepID=A0A4U0XTI7_9PEZI|nr:hypothetical protein B0A49_04502 [Cryomyces minteri]
MDFKEAQVPTTSAPLENATARPSFSQGQEALKDVVFGSAAGIVGKFIEYPFDTVKVRLQSQAEHLPLQYSGPLDCFKQSLRKDGISSLYRGISAPLFGAAVETSSLFFSYRVAQEILTSTILTPSTPLPMTALVACGAVSGAFTSMLLTPIELIKCKMQVPVASPSSVTRYPGPLSLIVSVYRHHGFFGFWHGQLGTLIRETGGSAAWFGSYEGVSLAFKKTRGAIATSGSNEVKDDSLPVYQQMVAGAAAGMSYNFIFYPADTIKSRMQTEEIGAVNAFYLCYLNTKDTQF